MEVITRKGLAAIAAGRWKQNYCYGSEWGSTIYGCAKETYEKIVALGENPDPDSVDKAIGNNSWTQVPDCDECGEAVYDNIVRLGDEPDYESSTVYVCFDCLKEAMELANKE